MAKLTGYRWISVKREDDRRYSDWTRAVVCERCAALIVHAFEVTHGDGRVEVVGRDCAHLALGRPVAAATFAKVEKAALAAAAEREALTARALRAALPTRAEAARACRLRNPTYAGALVTFEVAPGAFYSLPAGAAADSLAAALPAAA